MIASHYVIEEILRNWDDTEIARKEFEKFAKRYPEDKELQEIYNEFIEHLNLSREKLEKIKMKIYKSEDIKKQE